VVGLAVVVAVAAVAVRVDRAADADRAVVAADRSNSN